MYLFNNNYYKISPATNTNVLRHNFSMILSSSVPHPVACLQTPRLQSLPVSMTSDDKHLVSTSAKLLQKYCLHSWIKAEPGCKCTMHCTKWGEFESFSLLFTQGFFKKKTNSVISIYKIEYFYHIKYTLCLCVQI